MATWPSFMPQNPFDGFSITEASNRVSATGDVGEPQERKRSTAAGATYTWRLEISTSTLQLFRDWWQVDIAYGLKPFDWRDPFSDTIYPFKLVSDPKYTHGRGGWIVDLQLYLFPGYIPPEIVDVEGRGTGDMPAFAVAGAGAMRARAFADAPLNLPAFAMSGAGVVFEGVAGSGALGLPVFEMSAYNVVSRIGHGAMKLPAFEMTSAGEQSLYGDGGLDLPRFTMASSGTVTVTEVGVRLQSVIAGLGLTSGQAFCLDAGDGNSYPGTGQVWADASAAGNDFVRGLSAATDIQDPTFNGSPDGGTADEYFSFDGNDAFWGGIDAPTYDDPWHQQNGTFTILGMLYLPTNGGGTEYFLPFSNRGQMSTQSGMTIRIRQLAGSSLSTRIELETRAGSGPSGEKTFGTLTIGLIENGWLFFAVAYDEAGGSAGSFNRLQTSVVTYNGDRTGTGAPAFPPMIGAMGSGAELMPAGARIGCIAAWGRKLTAGNVADIYTALRGRYPTLP